MYLSPRMVRPRTSVFGALGSGLQGLQETLNLKPCWCGKEPSAGLELKGFGLGFRLKDMGLGFGVGGLVYRVYCIGS